MVSPRGVNMAKLRKAHAREREAAVQVARKEGLATVLREGARPAHADDEFGRSARLLEAILERAQLGDGAAAKLWKSACRLGPGDRKINRKRATTDAELVGVIEAQDRPAALTGFLEAMGLDAPKTTAKIDRLVTAAYEGQGRADARRRQRGIGSLPITRAISKAECFVILDAAIEVAGWDDYFRSQAGRLGTRVKKIHERRQR